MLSLIDLDIPELGTTKFISTWLYQGAEGTFIVDPGPTASIPTLLEGLEGVDEIDYILLTHIHLDHSGGIGHLMEHYPDAKIVVHPKGVKHLVDPTRLWEGSLDVLKNVAEIYKEPKPIDEDMIFKGDMVPFGSGIRVIQTPGHASHHLCFKYQDIFFAGELLGTHLNLDGEPYLRPATPRRFELDGYLASLEKVRPFIDKKICFAHYGIGEYEEDIPTMVKDQLKMWVETIREHVDESDDDINKALLEADPMYRKMRTLDKHFQERETHFTYNSIDGMRDYIRRTF